MIRLISDIAIRVVSMKAASPVLSGISDRPGNIAGLYCIPHNSD